MMAHREYDMVIGLEVHIQLNTKTKLFSPDTTVFGAAPNSQTHVVSLAHPGSLPVLNASAVDKAIRLGLAFDCEIAERFYFDRKHYFYPDSPLGYQITQQNKPICQGGAVSLPMDDGEKRVDLEKIHLEADAGKSIHDLDERLSMIDLNRAGMPLMELVTQPVMHSADEAGRFVAEVQRVVRFLGVGDANMEEGSLRCDVNVSLQPKGSQQLGQKVEVKNMNSIRHIRRAVDFEFKRQSSILNAGGTVTQESRLFDINSGETHGMRGKEEAHDYRYFPDPDLAPVRISKEKLRDIRQEMPILPAALRVSMRLKNGINTADALVLSDTKLLADLTMATLAAGIAGKEAAKWLVGPVKGLMNQKAVKDFVLTGKKLAELIKMVEDKKITYRNAVDVVLPEIVVQRDVDIIHFVEEKGLSVQGDAGELEQIIKEVLAGHPKEVEAYKSGKKAILQLFMGKVMKATRGGADPVLTMKLLKDKLS